MSVPVTIAPSDVAELLRRQRELEDARLVRDEADVRVRRIERDWARDLEALRERYGLPPGTPIQVNPTTGELIR